jgi:hypothetical protein
MDQFRGLHAHPILRRLISSCGDNKDIVYENPVTSLGELKLRIVTANETVTPQMLENAWREIEYRLDILLATKGARVEVVWHCAAWILQIIKLFQLHFLIPSAVLYFPPYMKNIGHGNPDNNLQSPCIFKHLYRK